jgi:Tol biopolymer transport system component
MKRYFWLVIIFLLSACNVASPTLIPAQSDPQPTALSQAQSPANPQSGIPSWATLNLTGRLVLILPSQTGVDIASMDLVTGKITPIYQAPQNALLSTALVSPDVKRILMAYAPPATENNQVTYTNLYLMPLDGSSPPEPLITRQPADEAYFAPTWAPDGQSVYTSHFIRGSSDGSTPDRFAIDRVTLDGQSTTVIKDAQWPSISPDGSKISFVPGTPTNNQDGLYLADISGANPVAIIQPGVFPAIDDHFFTPDGKSIIFSAVNNSSPAPTPTFWDRLLGIKIVSAHNIPSDWYIIPVTGGTAVRLTNLEDIGMYASLSPDKKMVGFISQTGLYVMNLDGSNINQLNDLVATGTVSWIP